MIRDDNTNPNTFAQGSDVYAHARPSYPRELYDWILQNTTQRRRAWDCATGNGQAAVELARHFTLVTASDLSVEQIAHAIPRSNVAYCVCPAETTSFPSEAFDLVTVAQALHWFDFSSFWSEVTRVAAPGAMFCAWGYSWFSCPKDVEHRLVMPIRKIIEPFWATNNRILWDGYLSDDIKFPFARLPCPAVSIQLQWTVQQLVEYIQTWSAFKRAAKNDVARSALDGVLSESARSVRSGDIIDIAMPLSVVAGRIKAAQ